MANTISLGAGGRSLDGEVAQAAGRCAQWLIAHFGQDVEVRANGHGKSGGVYHNGEGDLVSYGLRTERYLLADGRWSGLAFHAQFIFCLQDAEAVRQSAPYWIIGLPDPCTGYRPPFVPVGHGDVSSPDFVTLEEAGTWLLQWGQAFCPDIRRALKAGNAAQQ